MEPVGVPSGNLGKSNPFPLVHGEGAEFCNSGSNNNPSPMVTHPKTPPGKYNAAEPLPGDAGQRANLDHGC